MILHSGRQSIQVAAIPWPSTWPSSARVELSVRNFTSGVSSARFLSFSLPHPASVHPTSSFVRRYTRRRGVILVARGPRCTDRSSAACSTKGATFRASTAHNATRTATLSLSLSLLLSTYPSNECQERYSAALAKSRWHRHVASSRVFEGVLIAFSPLNDASFFLVLPSMDIFLGGDIFDGVPSVSFFLFLRYTFRWLIFWRWKYAAGALSLELLKTGIVAPCASSME